MAENSSIEWCDHTFNPWEGCQKVGPGCDNCYAEARDIRFTGGAHWGPGAPRRLTSDANWRKPLVWNAQALKSGIRPRVFCASLADVFDNAVDPEWRARLWELVWMTPHLDWLLLTKRPGNISDMLPTATFVHPAWRGGWRNVWLGCTVVNQAEADRDLPKLLATPAAVRFISAEPLLGPVDLTNLSRLAGLGVHEYSALDCDVDPEDDGDWHGAIIDWVITGGESGKNARPAHPDWFRSLRDQCAAAGVAFNFKQWGEWISAMQISGTTGIASAPAGDGRFAHPHRRRVHGGALDGECFEGIKEHHDIIRVGKARAGRLLDGVEHNGFPVARP
jgi:protein gp37